MDTVHTYSKKINLFWLRKCIFCKKIKWLKKLYKCSCNIICHKKCHDKFVMAKTVVQKSVQHTQILEEKGDGLEIGVKHRTLTNQDIYEVEFDKNSLEKKNVLSTSEDLQATGVTNKEPTLTSTSKNDYGSKTNFLDTEIGSNLLFGNVSDVEYHKLCIETDDISLLSSYTDTVISKNKIEKVKINKEEFKELQTIIINGKDVLATSTSSETTTAFVVPIVNYILKNVYKINGDDHRPVCFDPLAIIIAPTKQRVKNIYNVINHLITNTEIKCEPLFKINSISDMQKRTIQNGVHILVSDPECLSGIVTRGWITFADLRIIVFDEADSLLKAGYKPEIEFILNNKTMVSTDKRTTVLLSNTVDKDVEQIARTYLKTNYVSIDVKEMGELEEAHTT